MGFGVQMQACQMCISWEICNRICIETKQTNHAPNPDYWYIIYTIHYNNYILLTSK